MIRRKVITKENLLPNPITPHRFTWQDHKATKTINALLVGAILLLLTFPIIGSANTQSQSVTSLFELYQLNRKENIPNYITQDLLLVSYQLLENRSIRTLEEKLLIPGFQQFIKLLNQAVHQPTNSQHVPVNKRVKDLSNLLTTLLEVTQDTRSLPNGLSKKAEQELNLITQAQGTHRSPLWGILLDYSKLRPTGHYSTTTEHKNYYISLKYLAGIPFLINPSQATGTDKKAIEGFFHDLLAFKQIVIRDQQLTQSLIAFEALTKQVFGKSEDPTLLEIINYPEHWLTDLNTFRKKLNSSITHTTKVIDFPIDGDSLASSKELNYVSRSVRLIATPSDWYHRTSQVLLNHSGILSAERQNTTSGQAGIFGLNAQTQHKEYISIQEILATLTDKKTSNHLIPKAETHFAGYSKAFSKAKKTNQDLYPTPVLLEIINNQRTKKQPIKHLGKILRLKEVITSAPEQTQINLETSKAFLTWHLYNRQLYQKQNITLINKSFSFPNQRPGASVEPAIGVYLTLKAQAEEMLSHSNGLPTLEEDWQSYIQHLDRVLLLADQLAGTPATSTADNNYLNQLDLELRTLTQQTDFPILVRSMVGSNEQLAVYQAIGLPKVVFPPSSATPAENKARGARLSHYEFKLPLQITLNEETWLRQLLKGPKIDGFILKI